MTTKVVRGQMVVITAAPLDPDGNPVVPDSIKLYLNYVHSDGVARTDEALEMVIQTDGTWKAEFDTAAADPGPVFASLRAEQPPSAEDIKFTITANAANPEPGSTA